MKLPINTMFSKIGLKQMALVLCFSIFTLLAVGQDFPPAPKALVSDFTNTLSPKEVSALENKLLAFEDSTSIQLAIVLVNSTDGYDVADYAVRLAKEWGIGQQKYNNGVILLAAIGDRAVTIQTGYGIEGVLPDAIAYRIIENEIKPAFKLGDYYQGLNAATNAIFSYTKGEYKAEPKAKEDNSSGGLGMVFIIIIVFVVIAFISKGGGNNKGGRVINGKGGSDLFWWMLLNSLGRGGGGHSGGGFGGGDSGGFGGFGGGDFGGGGASGRW